MDGDDRAAGRGERARGEEACYRLLVESLEDAVFMVGPSGRILTWAPAAEQVFGCDKEAALGRAVHDLLRLETSDGAPEADLERALREGRAARRDWFRRGDGSRVFVELVTRPLRGPGGEPRGFALVARDQTRTRQADELLEYYALELRRSNAELERFAQVASHDLSEPLRKVRVFADRFARKHAEGVSDEGRDLLGRIEAAAARMQTLIEDLLGYARLAARDIGALRPVELDSVVPEALRDLDELLADSGGQVEIGPLPTLEGHRSQLRQLFQNLIANALKFRRPGVAPAVSILARPIAGDHGDRWEIEIADNGIGFAPEHGERIFGLLQRLHGRSEYGGSGMGLTICRRIAERHHGTLTGIGAPGAGATFTLTLPEKQPTGANR